MNKIKDYNGSIFEDIKHITENSDEYWKARELQQILGYKEWRYFVGVIEKAQIACVKSKNDISSHFGVNTKIVKTGVSSKEIIDYDLSRYACYLIVQNANPKYENVALGQTYFAVQTRKMELTEKEYSLLSEDEKRLYKREKVAKGNKALYKIAGEKGVKNFDRFTNARYKGLYNGETADDIAKIKGLRYREEILDNMGSVELAANEFRISQTESVLEMQKEKSERLATDTHYNIGKNIREAMRKNGSIMPEKLPTPDKSIKELKKEELKKITGGFSYLGNLELYFTYYN